ncbi:kinase-like protein [Pluteus cervinus]|uniref:Kinase-like protein n=1 Tax=Pluteus cervinus TaxID=181527 RepID=A0ACD3BGM9_9AGAR|nr:kinase-like protein [Pluteus cervinus]
MTAQMGAIYVLSVISEDLNYPMFLKNNPYLASEETRLAAYRQLLLAADFLHCSGIVHGDNASAGQTSYWDVKRVDGQPIPACKPRYQVMLADLVKCIRGNIKRIQLIDFGEAFFIGSPPPRCAIPMSFRPPEGLLLLPLTKAVDLWSLGYVIMVLTVGTLPIIGFDITEVYPQYKVIGSLSPEWVSRALDILFRRMQSPSNMTELGSPFPLLEEVIYSTYLCESPDGLLDFTEAQVKTFASFVRNLMDLEPSKRGEACEMLRDPWLNVLNGTPEIQLHKGTRHHKQLKTPRDRLRLRMD